MELDGLERLNEEYAINVYPPGTITELSTGRILRERNIKLELINSTKYMMYDGTTDGGKGGKPVRAYPTWSVRANSNRIEGHRMDASQPIGRVYTDNYGKRWYNTWRGFAIERNNYEQPELPEAFLKMFLNLCGLPLDTKLWDIPLEYTHHWKSWEYVLDWCAYIVQNPGVKMATAPFIFSNVEGVGKSYFGDILVDIFGRGVHGMAINSKKLFGKFECGKEETLFVLVNEVNLKGSFGEDNSDALKDLITQKDKSIEKKGVDVFQVEDHTNYMFTGNTPDRLGGLLGGRRLIIHMVPDSAIPLPEGVQISLREQIKAFVTYLHCRDTEGFNHRSRARETEGSKVGAQIVEDELIEFIINEYRNEYIKGGRYKASCSSAGIARAWNSEHLQSRSVSEETCGKKMSGLQMSGVRYTKNGERAKWYEITASMKSKFNAELAQEAASSQQSVPPESSKLADEEAQFQLG